MVASNPPEAATNGKPYEKVGEIVSIFQRKGQWSANYQHGGRQVRKSLQTTSKKQARQKALAIERDILSGALTTHMRAPLISVTAVEYVESKRAEGLAPKTLKKYEHAIDLLKQLAEELGTKRVSQITPAVMDKFRARRTTELAKRPGRDGQKTAANDLVIIRQVVNFALGRKLSPRIRLPATPSRRSRQSLNPIGFKSSWNRS